MYLIRYVTPLHLMNIQIFLCRYGINFLIFSLHFTGIFDRISKRHPAIPFFVFFIQSHVCPCLLVSYYLASLVPLQRTQLVLIQRNYFTEFTCVHTLRANSLKMLLIHLCTYWIIQVPENVNVYIWAERIYPSYTHSVPRM